MISRRIWCVSEPEGALNVAVETYRQGTGTWAYTIRVHNQPCAGDTHQDAAAARRLALEQEQELARYGRH